MATPATEDKPWAGDEIPPGSEVIEIRNERRIYDRLANMPVRIECTGERSRIALDSEAAPTSAALVSG
jgi:hypothetical protein